ncbi:hydroxymethylglutaryl-CoA lyase [Pseudonocardia sp. KRD-184]|uniref:Hydroxymethylglutaryl-CoA lyase n=1 Tax=Pseudonocardia oceani TaxID=2792013 RepID=A0ABS6U944_9PSEU|nr:hydroxymethylglutaryl-CoA lyase [Pseudonocardia oceani]MBW0089084.1 hydroxymethylglutaryl-CoA lyase [Pseudonocardia oceani]MBW0095996.1 hydroxymethylglutaryl-CoA lyase [Pseudonocardia oceani]MBW0108721.1 hydroxymethylglutaryl-CoA lyase [Pseudonocardia oceani]MBW0121408.1 hydroxymethylglutaryl-CoA lyase [Pseudonocardia oceani]MBW0128732.1 hydroxymethylglutaryl-CoA lyase [Pseudonocardia oceani]
MSAPDTAVEIIEVGPRDGLQNQDALLTTAAKIELVERSIAAGLRRIEAVSFVHPGRVPQMADAEAVMAGVPRVDGVRYAGLVLNRRGAERAVAAGVDELNAVVVASDTFGGRNQGVTSEESVAVWREIAGVAHSAGMPATVTVAVAFGCPFEGEVPAARVGEVVRRVAGEGPAEIALADTVGVGVPTQVAELAEQSAANAPGTPLRFHFHNTRNTGYANAVAAVQVGVRLLDASLGGIGGCPFAPAATGNIATEDLVYLLERMGVGTGVDLAAAALAGTWVCGLLGIDPPALLGRAGGFPSASADAR